MTLWRIGWTGLLGALAGLVLFPRPARGEDIGEDIDKGVRADPPAKAPGSAPPSG